MMEFAKESTLYLNHICSVYNEIKQAVERTCYDPTGNVLF